MVDATRITFHPLAHDDLPTLHAWLRRPHVAEWWGPAGSLDELAAEYAPMLAGSVPHRAYVVQLDGAAMGFIQSYVAVETHEDGWWLDERDPGVWGIDQFIADPMLLGRGLGAAIVRTFVERLFANPVVTRVQTDPSPSNARAIRCYEKAGFHAVGEIDTPDGRALLMLCDRSA